MGGIIDGIFGSPEKSKNVNNKMLQGSMGPIAGYGSSAAGQMSSLLSGGFEGYKKNSGMDWMTQQGSKGILGNAAARGLLNSGATGKALVNYGNNQQQQYFGDYLKHLLGLGGLGVQAGGVLSDSGKEAKGKKNGLLGPILSVASGGMK